MHMAFIHFPLLRMRKHWDSKTFAKKSSDTGVVKMFRSFSIGPKNPFLQNKTCIRDSGDLKLRNYQSLRPVISNRVPNIGIGRFQI